MDTPHVHLWSAPAPGWFVQEGRLVECGCHRSYICLRCGRERIERTAQPVTP